MHSWSLITGVPFPVIKRRKGEDRFFSGGKLRECFFYYFNGFTEVGVEVICWEGGREAN